MSLNMGDADMDIRVFSKVYHSANVARIALVKLLLN